MAEAIDRQVVQALLRAREEIDGALETLEITQDRKLMADIRRGLAEARRGEGAPLRELQRRLSKKR